MSASAGAAAEPETASTMKPTKSSEAIDYYESAGHLDASGLEEVAALTQRRRLTHHSDYLLLVLVGMPARGKSFISAKLRGFLTWSGLRVGTFNAGKHRRETGAPPPAAPDAAESPRPSSGAASFFDSKDDAALAKREAIAMETLDALYDFLQSDGGDIGLFDATNSTRARRRAIVERTANRFAGTGRRCGIIFLETICDDARVLEMNMRTKVRSSPDFAGLSEDEALEDLRARVRNYEAVYETVREDEGAFIKLYNFSSKVECASIYGRMSKTVLPFLLAIHVDDRPIYLVALAPRKGEPEYGGEDVRVTHDDELRDRLAAWCEATAAPPTAVFASTVRGAVIAADKLKRPGRSVRFTSALAPLLVPYASAAGDAHAARAFDERRGGGESYRDLCQRLEGCLLDVEASVEPTLVLTHATPARALRAYFCDINVVQCMGPGTSDGALALKGSDHCVVELRALVGGGYSETIHRLPPAPPSPTPPKVGECRQPRAKSNTERPPSPLTPQTAWNSPPSASRRRNTFY